MEQDGLARWFLARRLHVDNWDLVDASALYVLDGHHAFLDAHASTMPRTALRYALEKVPPARRRRYMARGGRSPQPSD